MELKLRITHTYQTPDTKEHLSPDAAYEHWRERMLADALGRAGLKDAPHLADQLLRCNRDDRKVVAELLVKNGEDL